MKRAILLGVSILALAGCGGGGGGGGSSVDVGALAGTFTGDYADVDGNHLGIATVSILSNGTTRAQTFNETSGGSAHIDGRTMPGGNFSGHVSTGGNSVSATGTVTAANNGVSLSISFKDGGQDTTFKIVASRA